MKLCLLAVIVVLCDLCCITWAEASSDGYHYEKPSIPFKIPQFETSTQVEIANPIKTNKAVKISSGNKAQLIGNKVSAQLESTKISPKVKPHVSSQHPLEPCKESKHPHHAHHHGFKLGHSFETLVLHKTHSSHEIQQPVITAINETLLGQFQNQNQEYIYRIASNTTVHSNKTHTTKHVEQIKHLKLDYTPVAANQPECGQQSNESLQAAYKEVSQKRPHERRQTPYTQTLADRSYFD